MRGGKRRLTISDDLQIHFDENGRAGYLSKSRKTPESVEAEVQRWQEFVEEWLQAHEPPRRRSKHSPEELQFLKVLRDFQGRISKMGRRAGRSTTEIEDVVQSCVKVMATMGGERDFTPEQIEEMVSEVLDTLQ